MMNGQTNEGGRRVERILWTVLLGAQLIYGVIGFVLARARGPVPPGGGLTLLAPILGVLALSTAGVASFFWSRANAEPGSAEAVQVRSGAATSAPRSLAIVTWALDESIAIYGLVLALLGFSSSLWFLFIGLSIGLMLFHRPR